jgi:hypothetical protein
MNNGESKNVITGEIKYKRKRIVSCIIFISDYAVEKWFDYLSMLVSTQVLRM